jgi:hypothetical protein
MTKFPTEFFPPTKQTQTLATCSPKEGFKYYRVLCTEADFLSGGM